MLKPAMLKYKCFPLKVLKRLKVCENVFGLKSYLFYTSPSEKCPCFYISRLRSQCKGDLLRKSSWLWVHQQWTCSLTLLRATPKQSIKAEVRGICGVLPSPARKAMVGTARGRGTQQGALGATWGDRAYPW